MTTAARRMMQPLPAERGSPRAELDCRPDGVADGQSKQRAAQAVRCHTVVTVGTGTGG
jgi:hypothetical protein